MLSKKVLMLLLVALPLALFLSGATVVRAEDGGDDDDESVGAVPAATAEDVAVDAEDDDGDDETDDTASAGDDDDEDDDEDIDEDDTRSRDAKTTIIFPGYSADEPRFPAGKMVTALIGFHNTGNVAFRIMVADGSLRFPQDFSYHMQNFSRIGVHADVDPGEQTTIMYRFIPHPDLEDRDLGLQLNIHYVDADDGVWSDAVFNGTVYIDTAESTFSLESVVSYVLVAGACVGGFFAIKGQKSAGYSASTKKAAKKAAPVVIENLGTGAANVDAQWLQTMNTPGSSKKKAKASAQ